MQRMWRQLFAAIAGVVVVAGSASAQTPPAAFPPIPISPTPVKATANPAAPTAPGAGDVKQTAGGFNVVNVQGLPPREAFRTVVNQPGVPYGHWTEGCGNGCGNYKGDLGFMFGSCKSFFEPCGPQPCAGPFLHNRSKCGGGGNCGTLPFSKGYNTGCSNCTYDSYLNH